MFKLIGRLLVILLIACAIAGIFYLIAQNGSSTSSLSRFSFEGERNGFGGDGGFGGRGGFSFIGGLFGITGHLILVAIVTFFIAGIGKLFSNKPAKTAMISG